MEIDLTKATKQQLYEIATNDSNRLIDRYAAARELQERREKENDTICRN